MKKLLVLIGVVIAISACACLFVIVNSSGDSRLHTARITSDGEVIRIIDLDTAQDETFNVESENGTNTITVHDGKISVTEASCPDKICVRHGALESEYLPVICLPNRLVIELI